MNTAHRAPRHRLRDLAGVTLGIAAMSFGGFLLPATAAHAQETETTVGTDLLRLTTVSDVNALNSLSANAPVSYQIGVLSTPPTPGNVTLDVLASGALVPALSVGIDSCAVRWDGSTCAPGATTLSPIIPLADLRADANSTAGSAHSWGISSGVQQWLRVTVVLEGAATPGESANFALRAVGEEDTSLVPLPGIPPHDKPGSHSTGTTSSDGQGTSSGGISPNGDGQNSMALDPGFHHKSGPSWANGLVGTGTNAVIPAILALGAVTVGVLISLIPRVRRRSRK